MHSSTPSQQAHATCRGAYTYRRFTSADTAGFLDLYETVWGRTRNREWFRWRFEANPYLDDVPMVVAESDGELVGAEPCLVFRLQLGSASALAFQPADWIVHPDHRRRGLMRSMTEVLLDRYATDGPVVYFNFPSPALVPGLQKLGWRIASRPSTYYRVQNPSAFVAYTGRKSGLQSTATAQLARLSSPLAHGYVDVLDRLCRPAADVTVERHGSVPVDLLTALYERSVPDRVHVVRDEGFYRWRFANPRWETTTYVARRGDEVLAACVTCVETNGGVRKVSLLDVLPWGGADSEALSTLLCAVVGDAADADLVRVAAGAVPASTLRRLGFLSNDTFPLSQLSHTPPLAVRPASLDAATPWVRSGHDLADGAQWALTLADLDIA